MRPKSSLALIILLYLALPLNSAAVADDLLNRVEHGYVNNKGVKIHYVTLGQGPLMVMLHGYPDYWYTWRHQMLVLSEDFKVVAIDLRGYNKSDKPAGVENYAMRHLISDVTAVIGYPTLVIHGLEDKALLPAGFNSTWEVMDSDLTTVSIPNAGHFVQHKATDLVTRSIVMWLNR